MEFKLSVDFERLHEFRQLCAELKAVLTNAPPCPARWPSAADAPPPTAKSIEAVAVFMVARLYVELSYQAQTTNRAGFITVPGLGLLDESFQPLFGEDDLPGKLLVTAGWLKPENDGWFCERFAKLNANLAGNYTSREVKGAAASALERGKHQVAHQAAQQAMLLAPETFKRRDQTPILGADVQRLMVAIKTIDNALKLPGRTASSYTETLIADAAAVVESKTQEQLREFYVWLATNREHPRVPKTTEQILADFEQLCAAAEISLKK